VDLDLGSRRVRLARRLYVRHRLDVSAGDLLYGLAACAGAARGGSPESVVVASGLGERGVACLSVRTGWDLLLGALDLPVGGEVLVSAVTHPDMAGIVEAHGLVAVPVDLDAETLAPRRESLEAALSRRSRLLLVAHLFGGRVDLAPLADFAGRNGLLLVEDCAQAFSGPESMSESPADVSMYSFGQIKTSTALGGAVLRVEDPDLRARMQDRNGGLPVQPRGEYLARVLKTAGITLATNPLVYGLIAGSCRLLDRDLDGLASAAVRGFSAKGRDEPEEKRRRAGPELLGSIRRRPSAPLLAMLYRRLRTFDGARLTRRARRGEETARRLPPQFPQPGRLSQSRTHWLFPVLVPDPEALVARLRREGFDASRATSNIAAVEPPVGRPELAPYTAERMMRAVVFLPVYPELPGGELERMTRLLSGAADAGERVEAEARGVTAREAL